MRRVPSVQVALVLSLSWQTEEEMPPDHGMQRVQYFKELSIDNKRMYCGLHGYSLAIGEDLRHSRDRGARPAPSVLPCCRAAELPRCRAGCRAAEPPCRRAVAGTPTTHRVGAPTRATPLHASPHAGWDVVKLLYQQLDKFEWLFWAPLDSLFADAASSLDSLIEAARESLIVLQDASGDGAGGGVLSEPLLLRGKSRWSAKLLTNWWAFFVDGFGGGAQEALQLILTGMHEEERSHHVRIIEADSILASPHSARPLPWAADHHPPALLVSFEPASADREAVAPCPHRGSDRQMLSCLHTFSSHHLKALQSADARHRLPVAFDVTDLSAPNASAASPQALAAGSELAGAAAGWLTPRLSAPLPLASGPRSPGKFVCPAPPLSSHRLPSRLNSPERGADKTLDGVHAWPREKAFADASQSGADEATRTPRACAAGSTWEHMPAPAFEQFIRSIGTALGIVEGMSVLDAGAACGHALGVLQRVHRGRLHAVGVDGSKASVRYARGETQGSFCVGELLSFPTHGAR